MHIRLLFFAVFLLSGSHLFAQTGFYEAGYIIQGTDTVQGFIERTDEVSQSKSINFKADGNAASPVSYQPEELTGFGFRQDKLHFGAVNVDVRNEGEVTQAKRFAKLLLSGYVNLYKLQLPLNEQQIIYRTDNTFVYIIRMDNRDYTLRQSEIRKDNTVSLNKRYIGVLKAVLTDCPASTSNFDQLRFEDKEMVKAIGAYNICMRPEIQTSHYAYEVKPVVKHGPEVSYGKFVSPNTRIVTSSHTVSVGYFFDILKPDISRKHSSRLGLSYFYSHYKSKPLTAEITTGMHSVRLPVMAQFNLAKSPNALHSPFLNAGMNVLLSANKQIEYIDIYTFFSLGAGMYTKNLRWAISVDSEKVNLKSVKILNLTVGYRLDKHKS